MLQYVTRKLECQSIEDSEDDDETRNIKVYFQPFEGEPALILKNWEFL